MAFLTIQTWGDVAPFAGSIVAYQTDYAYFGAEQGVRQGDVQFGYVSDDSALWHETENGYLLSKLLTIVESEAFSMRALVDTKLKEAHLSMRFATDEELKFVEANISDDRAFFDFMTDKSKLRKILARQLSTPSLS